MAAKHLTTDNFDDAIKSGVTLVDFWATWCSPCQMQGPIVDKIADEFEGKAGVAKIDVDENNEVASKYGVRSIPTLVIFKDGEAVETMVGVQSKEVLTDKLNQYL